MIKNLFSRKLSELAVLPCELVFEREFTKYFFSYFVIIRNYYCLSIRQQMQQVQRVQSNIMREKQAYPPQVNVYNRNFYLRGAEQGLRIAQYESQIKQLANKPKISVSSYNILIEQLQTKLIQTIKRHCNSGIGDEGLNSHLKNLLITFEELQNIITEMCQLQNKEQISKEMQHFISQLWLILGEYRIQSEVNAKLVFTTLRIFMDPYNLSVSQLMQMLSQVPQFTNYNEHRQSFLRQYPQLADQTLTLQQVIKLWRKIRHNTSKLLKNSAKLAQTTRFTFKPEINNKSRELAEKSLKKYLESHQSLLNRTLQPKRNKEKNELSPYIDSNQTYEVDSFNHHSNKPPRHQILYNRRLQREHLNKSEQVSIGSSQISKTARPEQIRQIVQNLYVVKQRRQNTDFIKRDEEQQLKKCTFSPRINQNYNTSRSSVSPSVKGYSKQVTRLQKGRQEKEKKKQAYENLGRVKNFSQNYSKSPSRNSIPSFIDRDTPKLILEINIDGERVEKLALKGNENPHLVSKKFVIMHGLEQQMIQVLQKLVSEQLQNL